MKIMIEKPSDVTMLNERLADTFYAGGRYSPAFLAVAGSGFAAIYALTSWFGILGEPAPQLRHISLATFFLAFAQWLVLVFLARRKHGVAANFLATICVAIFAIAITIFWNGIVFLAVPVVLVTPFAALRTGMPRKSIPWFIILTLLCVGGVVLAEYFAGTNTTYERLQFSSSAAIASLAFLVATALLLFTITTITQNRNYRSLQSLLLTSFVIIVTIPAVMATFFSGIGAYANSQTQTFNTLKAITNLKENQITLLVDEIRGDADKIQSDVRFKQNILPVINPGDNDPKQTSSYRTFARSSLLSLQKGRGAYAEIMVLDTHGIVVLSTDTQHEGENYESQLFYRQGAVKFFTGFATVPNFGTQNLIVATPLFDINGQIIRGVVVLRSDANIVREIMESTPGFKEAETYLVDKNFNPVTRTRIQTQTVRSKAALSALIDNRDGQGTYDNYANETVLGYYKWYEPMQMAVIAEVPVNVVSVNTFNSLAGSSLLVLFVIGIAITAVAISAKSISDPIKELAQVTESYAAGKFSSRANVDRKDEIGALATSYNQLATLLQNTIGKLEQRSINQTKELESQTLRVRVAAEIARDAASAHDLDKLLDSSAELILERFSFYHTGIFLLDKTREYATLTTSPTEAGKQMISKDYKLRIGEASVVGRVAASGEPRITFDTDANALQFNNPLLPDTRSEMALPLRVGNSVIGVLDIQSEKPQAFNKDDMEILQVAADQIAAAIEHIRLLDEVERNLKELESAYGKYTREGWQKLGSSGQLTNRGYRFNNIRIEPIMEMPEIGNGTIGKSTNAPSNDTNTQNTIAIPIKLRGQQIGVISAKLKDGYSSRTVSTLQAATERFAAALESARLYEEARTRADREQSISHVTAAISGTTEYEEILRTTIREIGTILHDTDVSIQILETQDGEA